MKTSFWSVVWIGSPIPSPQSECVPPRIQVGEHTLAGEGGWEEPIQTKEQTLHRKKRLATFLSPAGMSLTKLSPCGNNLIIPFSLTYPLVGPWISLLPVNVLFLPLSLI